MRIQKCALAVILATRGWAQAPIDHRSTGPAVIPDSVSLEANIPYDEYKETVLDILQPKEPSNAKRPGVIIIHGGGWVNWHEGAASRVRGVEVCRAWFRGGERGVPAR
jgi:hypothetical protein